MIRKNFGSEFWNGPRLRESEIFLVEKNKSEAIGETDGDFVGRSER